MKSSIFIAILCIFILNIETSEIHKMDEILGKFIIDVTTSLCGSTSFTLFSCANTDDKLKFSKFMSANHKLHKFLKFSSNYEFENSILAHQNVYVIDLDCLNSYEILIEADKKKMFIAPAKWLLLQEYQIHNNSKIMKNFEEINETKLTELFGNFHIFPDSEVIVSQRNKNNNVIFLYSIYRPSPLQSLIIENRGIWDEFNGFQFPDQNPSSRRRTNLQKTLLKASVVVTHPDTIKNMENLQNRKIDTITKLSYVFSKLLVARMNATVNFTFTPTWGYKEKNGTWSGMIGEIYRGNADFGATGTFIIPSRIGVVDYINLYSPTRVRFIFRQPPLSYVSNVFTLPFSKKVWIAIFIMCILGFCLSYLSLAWEWERLKDPFVKKSWEMLQTKPAFGDNFLILVGSITQQGFAYELQTIAARIVVFMLLLLCLSLYAAYTANIVALLQSSSNSIQNLQDLMNSPLKIGIHDIVYNRYYMGTFEDPLRKEFYERRVKNQTNIWMSLDEGINKVRYEAFAFQSDLTLGYDVVHSTFGEDEKCGFKEIDYFYVSDPLFAIRHQSPYQEIFRVGAIWIEEIGIKQRYVNMLYSKKPVCNNQKKFVSAGINECYAAYLALGYGMTITFGILLLEILWSRKCTSAKIQSNQMEKETNISDTNSEINENSDDKSDAIFE